jgi:hypothetical protein
VKRIILKKLEIGNSWIKFLLNGQLCDEMNEMKQLSEEIILIKMNILGIENVTNRFLYWRFNFWIVVKKCETISKIESFAKDEADKGNNACLFDR